jgi:Tol biopolymer transport system component
VDDQATFYDLSMSPDGKRAAVTVTSRATGMGDIWIYDLARGVKDRFTSDPGFELAGVWAPDGRSIVYSDAPGGALPHLVRRTLASGVSEDVIPRGPFQFAGSFTRDGSALFFNTLAGRTKEDILRFDFATKVSTSIVATAFNEVDPQVSPDGKWLAFVSDASGTNEVYVLHLAAGTAERIRISRNGGSNPRWRGDGQEFFYRSTDGGVMSVVATVPGDWSDSRSKELFRTSQNTGAFAVTPDGQSFLLMENTRGASDGFFNVVLGLNGQAR